MNMKDKNKENTDANSLPDKKIEELYIKPPSFFKMALSFTAAAGKHLANGMRAVTQEVYMNRLNACQECPFLIDEQKRCGKCGCNLEHKAKWETSECPDKPSRWENGGPTTIDVKDVDYPRTGGLSPDTGPRN